MHTKGPWRVSKNKARRVTNEHGVVICNAVLRNQGGPKHKAFLKDEHEAEANADLIAAAPDLVKQLASAAMALDEAANVLEATSRGMAIILRTHAVEARAAIARATGAGA